jgi:glycosyltransferase involved in cell wall biosynthesis
MKVMQVLAGHGWGGMEKHVAELSRGLALQGDDVLVVCSAEVASLMPAEVGTSVINFGRARWNPFLRRSIGHVIQAEAPDIVHAQGSKAVDILAGMRSRFRAPLVGTLHNFKKRTSSFARCDLSIAVSRGLAASLVGPHRIIYNGVDCPQVGPSPSIRGNPVLAVGRLVPAKGFDLLIQAWKGLPFDLEIAGDGPEKEKLDALIRALGLGRQVRLLGRVDDVTRRMRAAAGVVISSRREGFSYVAAEALLTRTPLLSTDVPVANEVLDPSLILPTDPALMHQHLAQMLSCREEWAEACQPAFAFAAAHFSLQAMVEATRQAYLDLLAADDQSSTVAR